MEEDFGDNVKSFETLDVHKNKVQNKASDEDMFDFLYSGQNNSDNIYGDILNPETNETMVSRNEALEKKVKKLEERTALLISQISLLTNLNKDLREKNVNFEKNLSSLKVTARTEINRKNEQITSLRRELDDVLFRRSARNINRKELDDIFSKHKSSSCAGCTGKILLPDKMELRPGPSQQDKKDMACGLGPDVCVGNRQVPAKKIRRICDDNLAPPQNKPEKKIKLSEEVEKTSEKNDPGVKVADEREKNGGRVKVNNEREKLDLITKYLGHKQNSNRNRKSKKPKQMLAVGQASKRIPNFNGEKENSPVRQPSKESQVSQEIAVRNEGLKSPMMQSSKEKPRSTDKPAHNEKAKSPVKSPVRQPSREQTSSTERQKSPRRKPDSKPRNDPRHKFQVGNPRDQTFYSRQSDKVMQRPTEKLSRIENQWKSAPQKNFLVEQTVKTLHVLRDLSKGDSKKDSKVEHRSRSRNRGERGKSGDRVRRRYVLGKEERGRGGDRGRSEEGRKSRSRSREGRRKRPSGRRSRSRGRSPRQRSTSRGRSRPRSRTASRSRGNRGCRSRSQVRKSSMERLKLMSRRSQSLSPERVSSRRQRKVKLNKDLRKEPGTQREQIPVEDTEDSLGALIKQRNAVWAQLAAMASEEDLEEGEIVESEDEITESSFAGINYHANPQPPTYSTPPTVSQEDLPINVSNEELLTALENMPKVSPIKLSLSGVEVRAPSESESEPDSPFPDTTPLYETNYSKIPLQSISSLMLPPEPLSPCRTLSPWRKTAMKSPQSTHARPLDFTSPEGISNLLKSVRYQSPIVESNRIVTAGAAPILPDNITKAVTATENDVNVQVESGNVRVTKVVPKESRNVSSPSPPVIQEDSSRDSVTSQGSAKKKKRKLARSQVSSVSAKDNNGPQFS